ncbi:Hypothetical predicted protein [Marmota monax]|uniref:Uncharacterized protein n=1 Tax=Marmota monax TaxID=9995 RepID=A0A5E4CZG5_MARMO|nr:Hypothetical predicted protein [Marmota monax]
MGRLNSLWIQMQQGWGANDTGTRELRSQELLRRHVAAWSPPPGDVTALTAVALKKGCSRMLSRWAAALRDAALQV